MKIIFWNIGPQLSKRKLDLIAEAIDEVDPDFFCVAEGCKSKINCQSILDVFQIRGYYCYYSPFAYQDPSLSLNYKYEKFGLAIFVKDSSVLSWKFAWADQRHDGRVVKLTATINKKATTIVFLHNLSKLQDKETRDKFLYGIREMLDGIRIPQDTLREIIIGDFNLKPWDAEMRHKLILNSNFIGNRYMISKRAGNSVKAYFNPILESVMNSAKINLGGTRFKDGDGWSLLDYCLYDKDKTALNFDVLTQLGNGSKLLKDGYSIRKNFLNAGFDHLPIMIHINN